MATGSLPRTWALIAGAVLILVGVLGFFANPIVGSAPGALVATDTLHNIVHIGTGVLALAIASMKGDALVNGLFGFGILYAVVFVLVLISPNLLGLFSVPANAYDHVIHAALAAVTLGVAYMARSTYQTVRA